MVMRERGTQRVAKRRAAMLDARVGMLLAAHRDLPLALVNPLIDQVSGDAVVRWHAAGRVMYVSACAVRSTHLLSLSFCANCPECAGD